MEFYQRSNQPSVGDLSKEDSREQYFTLTSVPLTGYLKQPFRIHFDKQVFVSRLELNKSITELLPEFTRGELVTNV